MSVIPRTLRFRLVLVLLVAFLLSAGLFTFVMNQVVETNYQRLESEAVALDVTRVRGAVEQQVAEVNGIAGALTVQSGGSEAPLTAAELADLGIDFVLVTDAQGQTLGSSSKDASGVLAPEAVTELSRVSSGGAVSGLVLMQSGPAAVSSRPLPNGRVLVAGRYLLPQASAIGKLAQSDVTLDDPAVRSTLPIPAGQSGVTAISDDANLGWAEIDGLDGAPALLAVVKVPRAITLQAKTTQSYIQGGIALLSLLVGLSIVLMLEGSVLHRLAKLRVSVIEFDDDGDALKPVAAEGSDEIADLAIALNDTLGRMKASEESHKHDARHDHLTGLANRRSLEEEANRVLSGRLSEDSVWCTLVLLDLDGFKRINDDLGHQVGDEVLVWFADHMRECMRADSSLCRLGGDEFGMLLPRTNREEAAIAIERLREATSREDDNPCFGMAQVRFSVGYAVAPDHGETLEMLSQCADTDLYANKRGKTEVA